MFEWVGPGGYPVSYGNGRTAVRFPVNSLGRHGSRGNAWRSLFHELAAVGI